MELKHAGDAGAGMHGVQHAALGSNGTTAAAAPEANFLTICHAAHGTLPNQLLVVSVDKGELGLEESRPFLFQHPAPTSVSAKQHARDEQGWRRCLPVCSRRWLMSLAAATAVTLVLALLAVLIVNIADDAGSPVPASGPASKSHLWGPSPSTITPSPPPGACGNGTEGTMACDFAGRPRELSVSGKGIVATDQGTCSEVGAQVLRNGGHAVDAAVAAALCLGVVNMFASGLGGGDFMLVRLANGTSLSINSRETAPAAATPDMFDGKPPVASITGGLAVAVPLQLKGLEEAWRRFGRRPWAELVAPAARLARDGFPAHPYLVSSIRSNYNRLLGAPSLLQLLTIPLPNGTWRVPLAGELCCRQPALAATLDGIAAQGSAWLYAGNRSAALAAEIQEAGGIMTAEDLRSTQPVVTEPLTEQVGDLTFIFPPPPSSAATLVMGYRMLSQLSTSPAPSSAVESQRMVEVLKHMFAVRAELADPGVPGKLFVNISAVMASLFSPDFASTLAATIHDTGVLPREDYGGQWNPFRTNGTRPPDDNGTSHMSVLDAEGNAVALTMTVNGPFGSALVSRSTGILLNNEMDDFSIPNRSSLWNVGNFTPNIIKPGKRPLSSMSPMVVLRDGKPLLIIGASGGTRIISAVLQTLYRLLLLQRPPLDSVSSPRLHQNFLPSTIFYENFTSQRMTWMYNNSDLAYLAAQGNLNQSAQPSQGVCQFIMVDQAMGTRLAVSDPRKDGAPAAQ